MVSHLTAVPEVEFWSLPTYSPNFRTQTRWKLKACSHQLLERIKCAPLYNTSSRFVFQILHAILSYMQSLGLVDVFRARFLERFEICRSWAKIEIPKSVDFVYWLIHSFTFLFIYFYIFAFVRSVFVLKIPGFSVTTLTKNFYDFIQIICHLRKFNWSSLRQKKKKLRTDSGNIWFSKIVYRKRITVFSLSFSLSC